MFCPKCAAQNVEGAHFCRACGANVSLIPQALNGQLPTVSPPIDYRTMSRRWRRRNQPSLEEGVRSLLMGIGFIVVAISIGLFGGEIGGRVWWFWLLIPAFGMLSRGISEMVRAQQVKAAQSAGQQQLPYAAPPQNLPADTNELKPPIASVTEGTTRHLATEAPPRRVDLWDTQKPS